MHGCKKENPRAFGQLQVDADNAIAVSIQQSGQWLPVKMAGLLHGFLELTKSNQGHVYGSMHA
jgi:hypothetical protein